MSAILAGQVIGVRRKGDSQVFVQLEDGRGRVECSAFSDAMAEFGHLLTRDRILIVKGGLREDEFNGGYSLRIRQCWDYEQICADHAQRLSLRLDLRENRPSSASTRCWPSTAPARLPCAWTCCYVPRAVAWPACSTSTAATRCASTSSSWTACAPTRGADVEDQVQPTVGVRGRDWAFGIRDS